jgi:type VI secretion system protein ImpA
MIETKEFSQLSEMMSTYDAEGATVPLKKGGEPFSWKRVIQLSSQCLQQKPNMTVAVWMLKAVSAERDLEEMKRVISQIEEIWKRIRCHEDVTAGVEDLDLEHEVMVLSWIGTADFVRAMKRVKVSDDLTLEAWSQLDEDHRDDTVKDVLKEIQLRLKSLAQDIDQQELAHLCSLTDANSYLTQLIQSKEKRMQQPERELLAEAAQHKGGVNSRDEVDRSIDELIGYFEQYEPSHPAPILLRRIKKMVGADFRKIMTELYVESEQMVAKIERPMV